MLRHAAPSLVLVGLLVSGCGVAAMWIRPIPPAEMHALDAATAWPEITSNLAAKRTGTLIVRLDIAMPELPPSRMEPVSFEVMPYAEAGRRDLETLFRWRYDASTLPGGIARQRDAPQRILESLRAYWKKLDEAGISSAARAARSSAAQEARLADLPAGDYLLVSESRHSAAAGAPGRAWAWLVRVRVEAEKETALTLDNDNAFCFTSTGWLSRTGCRPATAERAP
jgi:hypothetical protein